MHECPQAFDRTNAYPENKVPWDLRSKQLLNHKFWLGAIMPWSVVM